MDRYATVQDMRDRGVSEDVADDLTVLRALGRATLVIEGYCGRSFSRREETYLVDGTGRLALFLDDRPVIEVAELKVDGRPNYEERREAKPLAGVPHPASDPRPTDGSRVDALNYESTGDTRQR